MAEKLLGSGLSFEDAFSNQLNREAEYKMAVDQANAQMVAQRSLQMQQQQASAQATAIAQAQQAALEREKMASAEAIYGARQTAAEKKAIETGQARTLQQLSSGVTAIDRNALREVAQYTGGGKFDPVFGNLIGIEPEQTEMVSFLTPINKIKNYLQRASIYPEFTQLAKLQVQQSYGITDPKEINKRLNLISQMPLQEAVALTDTLRKSYIAKVGDKIYDWANPNVVKRVNEQKSKIWGDLEKAYKDKITDEDLIIQQIKPTTITPGAEPFSNNETNDFETIGGGSR